MINVNGDFLIRITIAILVIVLAYLSNKDSIPFAWQTIFGICAIMLGCLQILIW